MEIFNSKKTPKLKHGFKAEAERISLGFRTALGLEPYDFLCAFKLCEHLSIPILVPNDIPQLDAEHLNELLTTSSSQWSALTMPIGDRKIIIHNPTHSKYRQQSNIMHEVGHIICKHEIPLSTLSTGLITLMRNYDKSQEDEADWLGSTLQLPRPALIKSWYKFKNIEQICEYYSASDIMVKYRYNMTGTARQLGIKV